MHTSPPPTQIHVRLAGPVDGLFLAPIDPASRWTALRDLRNGMAELRRLGLAPRLAYVLVLSRDGRIVSGASDDAVLYLLAYRFVRPALKPRSRRSRSRAGPGPTA